MIKRNCTIVGIEVRNSVDPQTKAQNPPRYYLHASTSDAHLCEGVATLSGKLPDSIVPDLRIGDIVNVVYRSFNGYNTVEDVYHG